MTTTNDGLKRGLLALLAMTGLAGGVLMVLGAAERKGSGGAPPRASNPLLSSAVIRKNRYGEREKTGLKGGTGGKGAAPKVQWAIQQDAAGAPTRVVFRFYAWEDAWDMVLDQRWSDPRRAERFAIHAAAAFAKHLKKHGLDGAETMWDKSTGWWSEANAPDLRA